MRRYEAVFIYPPGEAAVAAGKQVVAQEFAGHSGQLNLIEEEDMHERSLAYEVKGSERGHYFLYTIEAEAEAINAVDKALKIKPEVLKFTFFREDSRLRQKRPSQS
jgi:ribosomal protein S6